MCSGGQPRRRQPAPGPGVERPKQQQHQLRRRTADIAVAAAAVAASGADLDPVGGAVDGAGEAGRVHEGLQKQEIVMVLCAPVGHDAPFAQRQEAGAEIGPPPEQQHSDVVGDQVQAPVLDAQAPADPIVPGRAFERGGREGGQGHPVAVAEISGIPDALADLGSGPQIVVAVHELVEAGLHLPRNRLNSQLRKNHRIHDSPLHPAANLRGGEEGVQTFREDQAGVEPSTEKKSPCLAINGSPAGRSAGGVDSSCTGNMIKS